jgi:hypothetical protein
VTVPKFAEGKSFMFCVKINHTACDSKERSQPVPYTGFFKSHRYIFSMYETFADSFKIKKSP